LGLGGLCSDRQLPPTTYAPPFVVAPRLAPQALKRASRCSPASSFSASLPSCRQPPWHQDELGLLGGFGWLLDLGHRGDLLSNSANQEWIYRRLNFMNNFVSPDLYQPDYGDFTIESKGCESGSSKK
jgi:hypothetical protein